MGTFKQSHPLKVYLSDISPHSQAILEFFIGSTGGKTFTLVATAAEADAYITDFDYPGSKEHWEAEHAVSAKPCIALSIEDPQNPLVEWVSKPITANALVDAGVSISQKLQKVSSDNQEEESTTETVSRRSFKRPPPLPGLSTTQSPFRKKVLSSSPAIHTAGYTSGNRHHAPVIREVAGQHDDVAVAERPKLEPKVKQTTSTPARPQTSSSVATQQAEEIRDDASTQDNSPARRQVLSVEQIRRRQKLLCGNHENISHSKLKQNEELNYNSENFFLGTLIAGLRLAKQTKQVVQIKFEPHQFYICYDEYLVFSPLEPQSDEYAELCFTRVKPGQVNLHILGSKESNEIKKRIHTDANFTHDLESFIWTSSLLTSRGRVPSTLDCETQYLLKHWPNFTRIENFPFAMKIAARWQKKPYKLSEIAREMDIPIRYVIAFYNGVLGLSLFETKQSKIEQKINIQPPKNKGLIARLFGRLTRNEATS